MIRLEKSLDMCLERLKTRCSKLHADTDLSDTDDLDSIASGSTSINTLGARKSVVRFSGQHREVERLKQKLSKLEVENRDLQQQVRELKILLGQDLGEEEKKAEEEKLADEKIRSGVGLSEGMVWDILRKVDGRKKS